MLRTLKFLCANAVLAALLLSTPLLAQTSADKAAVQDPGACQRTYMTCLSRAGEVEAAKAQCYQTYKACYLNKTAAQNATAAKAAAAVKSTAK